MAVQRGAGRCGALTRETQRGCARGMGPTWCGGGGARVGGEVVPTRLGVVGLMLGQLRLRGEQLWPSGHRATAMRSPSLSRTLPLLVVLQQPVVPMTAGVAWMVCTEEIAVADTVVRLPLLHLPVAQDVPRRFADQRRRCRG